MPVWFIVLSAVSLAPTAHAQENVPPGSTAPAYVLVKRSATFYTRADTRAPSARDAWAGRFDERVGPYWTFVFVAEADGWIEIETTRVDRTHCYGTADGLEGMRLRLFVPSADVVPALAAPIRIALPEGGHVALAAGLGVERLRGRRHRAVADGLTVELDLDPAQVARTYRPAGTFRVAYRDRQLRPGARIRVGNVSIRPEAEAPAPRAPSRPPRTQAEIAAVIHSAIGADPAENTPAIAMVPVHDVAAAGRGRVRATIRTACVEIAAALASRHVVPRIARHGGMADVLAMAYARIRAGAPASWPDGARAGVAGETTALVSVPPARVESGWCVDLPLRNVHLARGGGALSLCFDEADLEVVRRP